jgi:hypothetical protein
MFLPSASEAIYFDAGFGGGLSWSSISGKDAKEWLNANSSDNTAVDLGFKLGGGLIKGLPFYFVGEVIYAWANTYQVPSYFIISDGPDFSIEEKKEPIRFEFILVGPGVVYYPMEKLQLAATFGGVYAIFTSGKSREFSTTLGYGYNLSTAWEFAIGQNRNDAIIVGARWMQTFTNVGVHYIYHSDGYSLFGGATAENYQLDQHSLGLFVKYAYKTKVPARESIVRKSDEYFK